MRNIIKITKPHVQGSKTFFTVTTSKLRMKSMGLFSAGSWQQLWGGWHCLAHTNSATVFHIAITSPELCAGSATLATQHVSKKSHCDAKITVCIQRRRDNGACGLGIQRNVPEEGPGPQSFIKDRRTPEVDEASHTLSQPSEQGRQARQELPRSSEGQGGRLHSTSPR